MSYDPFEHRPRGREIVAAWVICLGIVGLGLALSSRHVVPAAGSAQAVAATSRGPDGMAGVRLPGAHPAPAEPNPLLGSRLQPAGPMAQHRASRA